MRHLSAPPILGLLLSFALFSVHTLVAEGTRLKTKRYKCYYRFDGSQVLSKSSCDYYAVFDAVEGLRDHRHGQYKEYFADDSPKLFGQMENNRKIGVWKSWYNNGQPRAELEYETAESRSGSRNRPLVWSYWDEQGALLVEAGNGCIANGDPNSIYAVREEGCYEKGLKVGEWIAYDQLGKLAFKEVYQPDGEVSGMRVVPVWERGERGEQLFYTETRVAACPKGGLKAFYQSLKKQVEYPEEAKKEGIQGQVIIKFIVRKDGSLGSFRVMSDTHELLNRAAVKAILQTADWVPGTDRGLPVRSSRYLPLTFQLQE